MMNTIQSASTGTVRVRARDAGWAMAQGLARGLSCNGSGRSPDAAGRRPPARLLWDVSVAPVCPVGFVAVMAFGATLATSSHAYLDPGTGSMILQVLLGGVAGALVVAKLYWAKLKRIFKSSTPSAGKSSDDSQSTDTPD